MRNAAPNLPESDIVRSRKTMLDELDQFLLALCRAIADETASAEPQALRRAS